MSVNVVTLVGNLGKDPELHQFQNGGVKANLALATKSTWVDRQSGERKTATEWHKVIMFGKQAEIAEKWLRKGMLIYIQGSLKTRSYEKDGSTFWVTEIIADEMRMLSSSPVHNAGSKTPEFANNAPSAGMTQMYQNPQYTTIPSDTDELPPFMEMDSPF